MNKFSIFEAKQNNRLIWADALRGFLILSVVLGHSLQFGDFENRLSWNIIYSFHMAAFFVVSGYVGYKKDYKFSSLKQKATQLILPFLSWSILGILLKGYKWKYLYEVIIKPDSGYWFLFILFFINVFFIIIVNVFRKKTFKYFEYNDLVFFVTILGLISIMVVTDFRLFGFQFFALYFGFYIYGYWLRKFEVHLNYVWIIIFGVIWFMLALFWRMHAIPEPLRKITFLPSSLLIYSYRYITAFIGSLFFISFAMKFMNKNNVIFSILGYLGKISLGIYVIHLFIGQYISDFFEQLFNSNISIFFVLCDSITKLIISVTIINIIQHIPYVRLFLLGKK